MKYGKAIAATLGAVALSIYVALTDNHITPLEWILAGQAWIGSAGVYLVPLAPEYRWGKTAVGALFAGSEALVIAVPGGVDGHEWLGILIVVGAAAGIAGLPARSGNGVASTTGATTRARAEDY